MDIDAFVRVHAVRLYRIALGICGNPPAAEDLVAAALERCIPRWHAIRRGHLAYVRRAMVNLHLNNLRRPEHVVGDVPDRVLPEDLSAEVATRIGVADALSSLSSIERTIVMLRYFDDLSAGEVARLVDRPAGTVRRISHHALKRLGEILR